MIDLMTLSQLKTLALKVGMTMDYGLENTWKEAVMGRGLLKFS
jgi:hypothetical protein